MEIKLQIFRCCENSHSQPRGPLKWTPPNCPDPRRWSGCQGPAAHARRAGGAGCEDSALTWRAGGPRAQGYERVVRQRRSLASCARTAATVPWVPCDSTACERNRALPPRPPSFASHVFCREGVFSTCVEMCLCLGSSTLGQGGAGASGVFLSSGGKAGRRRSLPPSHRPHRPAQFL